MILSGLMDKGKSEYEPFLRKRVENPAKGPKSNCFSPLIIRESIWGTDMGGAPTLALPYTLASCLAITSGLVHLSHWPLTGKPPYPFPSGILAFSNKGKEPPPAPIKINLG